MKANSEEERKMLKILSIGNSFSENAQRYLKGVADSQGIEIRNVNLYIGGCSFERHVECMDNNLSDYLLEEYGTSDGKYVTLSEGLMLDDWDVITLQEVSTRSYKIEEFEPYMSRLCAYVREKCPRAKIMLHMTWGYGDEEKLAPRGFGSMREMYEDIKSAYKAAMKIIGVDTVIPAGEAMQRVADAGYRVHSDGTHANGGVGEYAIALLWLKKLFGVSVKGNTFRKVRLEVSEEDMAKVAEIVDGIDVSEKAIFG